MDPRVGGLAWMDEILRIVHKVCCSLVAPTCFISARIPIAVAAVVVILQKISCNSE